MRLSEFEDRYLRHAFAAVCAYEAAAVVTRRVPTVSSVIRWSYSRPAGRVVLWLAWGWLTAHLFSRAIEEGLDEVQTMLSEVTE